MPRGYIKNGTVQADEPFPWPDGTEVVVVPAQPKSLKSMLGLLATGQTPPSDDECDQIRESELLRDYGQVVVTVHGHDGIRPRMKHGSNTDRQ